MDKVREKSREVRLRQWAEIITTCRGSGMSIRAWCQENRVNEKRFYYWQRKLREMALENADVQTKTPLPKEVVPSGFVNVSHMIEQSTNMMPQTAINIGGFKIDIYDTAGEEAIKKSLKAVLELC